jgi:hypothetical protein
LLIESEENLLLTTDSLYQLLQVLIVLKWLPANLTWLCLQLSQADTSHINLLPPLWRGSPDPF